LWFGVDDSGMTVHVPIYCGITDIPPSLDENLADMMTFSFDSAFWVFNLVSNFVYTRYNVIYPEVLETILSMEDTIMKSAVDVEQRSAEMILMGEVDAATKFVTEYSVKTYEELVKFWLRYFQELFVKYMDGNSKTKNPKYPKDPNVVYPGYVTAWEGRIVKETGDKYKVPKSESLNVKRLYKKL